MPTKTATAGIGVGGRVRVRAGRRARRATIAIARIEEPVSNEPIEVAGYLDMREEGYGFLRVKRLLDRDDA